MRTPKIWKASNEPEWRFKLNGRVLSEPELNQRLKVVENEA